MKKFILAFAVLAGLGMASIAQANPQGGTAVVGADGLTSIMVECAKSARTLHEPGLVVTTSTGTRGDRLVDLDGYGTLQIAYNDCLIDMFESFNIGCIRTVGGGVALCHDFDVDILERQAETGRILTAMGQSQVYLFASGGGGAWESVTVGSPRDQLLRALGSVDSVSLAAYFAN